MHQLHTKHCLQRTKPTKHEVHTKTNNSMNIYCIPVWYLLWLFRYKFRNALLHLGNCDSHIISATKYVPFISFNIYQHQKGLFAKIWWSSMISLSYSSLTSAVATLSVNGCLTMMYMTLWWELFAGRLCEFICVMAIACFSSQGKEISPIPDRSSILLT